MANENVNKVIYGNRTVMDISDTTAEEADVAEGEVFYKANGARSVGTGNMGGIWGSITGDIGDQADLMAELAKKAIRLTQAQYNALTSAEKHDPDKVYYITDYTPEPIVLVNDSVTSLTSTWSSSKLSDDLNDKVDKVSGKGLSTNDFTTAEKTKLAGLQNYDDTAIRALIPTATSQLTNNSGFITNAVNNLVNYYLKSETYTKAEVDSLVSALAGIHFEYVATLPTENIQTNAIYLVPKADTQTRNIKEEYINLDGTTSGWEKIGDTEIDLSDYVTITDLNTALTSYVTSTDFTTALNNKSTQVRLTKAQYDALTEEEKHDTTKVYYITDYTPMPVNAELNDTVTASNKVWSSQKVTDEIEKSKIPTAYRAIDIQGQPYEIVLSTAEQFIVGSNLKYGLDGIAITISDEMYENLIKFIPLGAWLWTDESTLIRVAITSFSCRHYNNANHLRLSVQGDFLGSTGADKTIVKILLSGIDFS